MDRRFLQIGVIGKAHGLRGEVRVQLHAPESQVLLELSRIWIQGPAKGAVSGPFSIQHARPTSQGAIVLHLAHVVDRDGAEALRGKRVLVMRDDLPALADDEFYLADLVGLEALLPDGSVLGPVREIQPLPGNDLLLIQQGTTDVLVPVATVQSVRLSEGVVVIDPPEGLFEMANEPLPGPGPDAGQRA